ncbi:MAG: MBL fold metallo-hydrolase [Gammaproteobacteria bacterium]|nr:MBL fold metallo-hydrolase [Gammaproteobacteria bacterium]
MSATISFTPDLSIKPEVVPFLDPVSHTISYIVVDTQTSHCAVIDAVMDFDHASGRVSLDSADQLINYIREHELTVDWVIETHVHADHLSGAPYIQEQLGGQLGIGEKISEVQDTFGKIFNEGTEFQRDGSQFDRLFVDGDSYVIGNITAHVLHTPGHTPACMTHVIGDSLFGGDTLFMPDSGSARADFPGGDARTLFRSIRRVLSLPDEMRAFMCHDYGTGGREVAWETTIAEQRKHNIHFRDGISEDEFVTLREARDAQLDMPRLIIPSLQVNMRAGEIPTDHDGRPMLKLPINAL